MSPRALRGSTGAVAVSLLAVAVATLVPMPGQALQTALALGWTPAALTDVGANLLLFVPLGISLRARGLGRARIILLAALASTAVELLQLWIPGRTSSWLDVLTNALGALGGTLYESLPLARRCVVAALGLLGDFGCRVRAPAPRFALVAGTAWLVFGLALRLGALALAAPAYPENTYYVAGTELDSSDGPVWIGRSETPGEFFAGRIDEVRIYARGLTADEIVADMNRPVGVSGAARDLLAAFGFEGYTARGAHDESGAGRDGQPGGTLRTEPGRFGDALKFDGSTSQVGVRLSSQSFPHGRFTFEAWIWPTTQLGDWSCVMQLSGDSAFLYESTTSDSRAPQGGGRFDGVEDIVVPAMRLPREKWTHVAVTSDGGTLRFYVNGRLASENRRALRGTVDSATVAGIALETGRVPHSAEVRRALMAKGEIAFTARPDPPLDDEAVLFLLRERSGRDPRLFEVRASGPDLVVAYRSLGSSIGGAATWIRVPGLALPLRSALATPVSISGDLRHPRVRVGGIEAPDAGLTPDSWWRSFLYSDPLPASVRALYALLAAGLLAVPLGYFARGVAGVSAAWLSSLGGVWLCHWLLPSAAPTFGELAASTTWIAAGALLRVWSLRTAPK